MRIVSSLTSVGLAAAASLVIVMGGAQAKGLERGHRVPQVETSIKSQYNSAQIKDGSKAQSNEFRAEDIIPDICRGC